MFVIFLITTISTTNKKFSYSRTVGYFKDLNKAKEIVENNCYDLFETFYDYAVIEEVPEGIYPLYENQVWYKWNLKENKYEECERPEFAMNFGYCEGIG